MQNAQILAGGVRVIVEPPLKFRWAAEKLKT